MQRSLVNHGVHWCAATALAALTGAAGCGSSSNAENVAGDLAQTVCDFAFTCCTRGEVDFLLGPYVLEGDCADRVVNSAAIGPGLAINLTGVLDVALLVPNLGELQNAIDDGRTKVDRDAVDACIAYIVEEGCNEFEELDEELGCVPPELLPETPCATDLLFRGQVDEGDICTVPGQRFECKPGLVCRTAGLFGIEGACVAPGEEGDFCFVDAECEEELYCSQQGGTCERFKAEGETCAYSNPDDPSPPASTLLIKCEPLLSCDPVTDLCVAACERGAACSSILQCDEEAGLQCIDGRCDLPREEGLPCNNDLNCVEGLRCAQSFVDAGLFTCQQKLPNGQFCDGFSITNEDCASGFCDIDSNLCTPSVAPGGLCPTSLDPQCDGGYCDNRFIACSAGNETPCDLGSGVCNTAALRCEFYCVAQLPNGASCTRAAECQSEACVDFFCRTIPLVDGEPCTSGFQCESGFCGVDTERVCESLPMPNGKACSDGDQCASGICFPAFGIGFCVSGLNEGDRCDDPFSLPPCGADLFCDGELSPPVCVPVLEPGSECEGAFQCREACVLKFGRQMCDATPAAEAAICDGE